HLARDQEDTGHVRSTPDPGWDRARRAQHVIQTALEHRPEALPRQGGRGPRQAQGPPVRREPEREASSRGERATALARARPPPQADEARQADEAGAPEQGPPPDPADPQAQETPQAPAPAADSSERQGQW